MRRISANTGIMLSWARQVAAMNGLSASGIGNRDAGSISIVVSDARLAKCSVVLVRFIWAQDKHLLGK